MADSSNRHRAFLLWLHRRIGRHLYSKRDPNLRVVERLAGGETITQIANADGVTKRAVQKQLKRLRESHGVRTNEALVAAVTHEGRIVPAEK